MHTWRGRTRTGSRSPGGCLGSPLLYQTLGQLTSDHSFLRTLGSGMPAISIIILWRLFHTLKYLTQKARGLLKDTRHPSAWRTMIAMELTLTMIVKTMGIRELLPAVKTFTITTLTAS